MSIPLSYIVTGVICFEQAWSIFENESSCRSDDESRIWRLLQRIMIDKTERHFDVKLDELKKIVDDAIEKGYTVLWAADVSEKGFKWYDGVALMPKVDRNKERTGTELAKWVKLKSSEKEEELYDFKGPVEEIEVTQESRQKGFDNYETTDDHGMVIIGKAEDQKGNKYYKVKNSWDTDQVYQGYFYVSEAYFLSKTMSILVNKKAVPSDLLKKMGL